ncbi:DUF885 domain-containing protein [Hymenobacter wooponensis]|uniref:DUF885 domain-containing protein n=1 Tax=Hymenobacter wooponensis TaxID=1525360 RepID=A0A4Z0MQ90_9BACT|nr:DUF885 domain-containing protein [Hymenobacter wooponensis]TGD81508.1 DUF885 domain-containing protein [Hymenobacter wooponensis]
MRKALLRVIGLLLLLLMAFVVNVVWFKPVFIRLFYERVFAELLFDMPQLLSTFRLVEPLGIQAHNKKLDDYSEAEHDKQAKRLRRNLDILHSYDTTGFDAQQKLSYDILDWYMRAANEGEKFRYDDYPVNQLFGVQNGFPTFMATKHQVHNQRDAEYYTIRLSKVKAQFAQVLEGLKIREQHGVVPPTFVIDKVLTEMNGFVAQKPEENILYTSFAEKLNAINTLDKAEKAQLLTEANTQIKIAVYPAYHSLIAYFTALRPRSTTDAGVWKFPDGAAYYAYCLRQNTTTDFTPNQIHELGLKEVARIEAEMATILKAQSISGSPGQAMAKLNEEPRFLYPDTDSGRVQILTDYKRILSEVNQGMASAFHSRPKAALDVQRAPAFKEKTAPGGYYELGAQDGSRPGTFYTNLYDIKATPKFGMRTLAYHEGIPGHHFQISTAQELKGLPTFRTVIPFTAFSEGWALYAEQLAWELGFEQDPYDNLGRLQAELFRAVRLVVDTGIHDKRWTREQAIDYMRTHTGQAESDVVVEIERYIVNPGQACAYKMGMLKILELRERAKQALGPKFDMRDFHEVVLKNGAMPLSLLERVVNAYIEQKNKAA